MASINKVIIVGNIGRDPEVRYLPNGGQVTTVSVATSETWKDKNSGEKQERTEWHRVQFWGKLAEIASQYLKKGSQIYVEGRLRTNKYTGNDGIERYSTDIMGDVMQMLGGRQDGGSQPQNNQQQRGNRNGYQDARNGYSQQGYTQNPDDVSNDDIPF